MPLGGAKFGGYSKLATEKLRLVGRRLSADEMVKNFDPSKVRIEPEPKISQYQVELQKLENSLDELKNFYPNKIKSTEESIANLKKIKPE